MIFTISSNGGTLDAWLRKSGVLDKHSITAAKQLHFAQKRLLMEAICSNTGDVMEKCIYPPSKH